MPDDRFRHEVLYYAEGVEGFVAGTLPFVQRALAAEEPVLVAVGAPRIAGLKEALGDDAERVRFADMRALGGNPARIIPAWHEFLEQNCPDGGRAFGIGEPIWPGRSPAELVECHYHEALLNLAFDPGQAWHLLCPYDLDGLDDDVIEAARLSHPLIAHDAATSHDSDTYVCAHEPPRPLEDPLPPPRPPVRERTFAMQDLASIRHFVSAWAREERLGDEHRERLVLAVNELATNSIRHGGGAGKLLMWRESDILLCEVRDSGHIAEPLTGRRRPTPEDLGGRGLWLVNQLCNLVQVRSSPSGSIVRAHMRSD
ncbi:MAG TPA: sensor histidine kinase [Solirubrobacteraceae bacterium]|nr:sensor histidine kinase [Solirubrobacteraceae bacterium]